LRRIEEQRRREEERGAGTAGRREEQGGAGPGRRHLNPPPGPPECHKTVKTVKRSRTVCFAERRREEKRRAASRTSGGVPKLLKPGWPVPHPIFPYVVRSHLGSQRDQNCRK